MMFTRKRVLLLSGLFVLSFSLLLSSFGSRGIWVNRGLRMLRKEIQGERTVRELRLSAMLEGRDGFDETKKRTVIKKLESESFAISPETAKPESGKGFQGISLLILLPLSLLPDLLLCIYYSISDRRKKFHEDRNS